MMKEIEAIYEQGIIRPLQPLELAEGTRLELIVITHEQPKTNGNAPEIVAEIAALPLEGAHDVFQAANTTRFYIEENRINDLRRYRRAVRLTSTDSDRSNSSAMARLTAY